MSDKGSKKSSSGGRKFRIAVITAVLLLLAANFVFTAIVYGSIFARCEREVDFPAGAVSYGFDSGRHELTGMLFGGGTEALVVVAQGFGAVQEDLLPVVRLLCDRGFSVFTFDPAGVGRSSGFNQKGFPQMICDLEACIDFVEKNERFGCRKLCLLGHSRGGHAVCCLADRADCAAVVGAAATPMDGIMQGSVNYVGKAAYLNYPTLWLWQTILFGPELAWADAVKKLDESASPVLVVQGEFDELSTPERFSVYARREEITSPNVSFLTVEYGHSDALYANGEANSEVVLTIAQFFESCGAAP